MRSGNPPMKIFTEVRKVARPESNPLGAVKANPHHGGGKSQCFPPIAGVHERKKQPQLHEHLRESGTRSVALKPATSGKHQGRSAGRCLAEPGQQCIQTPLLSLVGKPVYKAAHSLTAVPVSGQATATMQASGALEEQKCLMFPMLPMREPKHPKPGPTLYAHRQLVPFSRIVPEKVEDKNEDVCCNSRPEADEVLSQVCHRPLLIRRAVLHGEQCRAVRSSPPRPSQVLKLSQDHVPLACQAVRKPPRQCKRQGSEAGCRLPPIPTPSTLNKCEGTSGVKVVNLEVPDTVPFKLRAFKGHRTRFP